MESISVRIGTKNFGFLGSMRKENAEDARRTLITLHKLEPHLMLSGFELNRLERLALLRQTQAH